MKRHSKLSDKIITLENLQLADGKARKGKKGNPGIAWHDLQKDANILKLQKALKAGQFRTSPYSTFTIFEPKERVISRLPYYPDRIVQHAILNILEPIFLSTYTTNTYSCIPGKGVHAAAKAVKSALRDTTGTTYCLKLDIVKFYPSIDHEILKRLLFKKFKDAQVLELLFEIIDSAPGLPIGNYLSQFFANFYLTYFDHWIKEEMRVKYYFRYADDLVILSYDKAQLHYLFTRITNYLDQYLRLSVKSNYQIFPVAARGIDFVGYKFYHSHALLRKSIKQSFARKINRGAKPQTLAAYSGWAKHCNSIHLLKKFSL